ncbi:hypothetical protein EI94DRAFT_1756710 [Lactarius quietus]|nr:hypothetical protein EI94DRAFT_1756710 [Lactarius quietus]
MIPAHIYQRPLPRVAFAVLLKTLQRTPPSARPSGVSQLRTGCPFQCPFQSIRRARVQVN